MKDENEAFFEQTKPWNHAHKVMMHILRYVAGQSCRAIVAWALSH